MRYSTPSFISRSTPKDAPMVRALVFLIVAIGGIASAGAVSADEQVRFRQFSVEQGLASNTVQAVHQDHLGYLWIGTTAGLQRYDGYSFETFRQGEVPGSLTSNDIRSLEEDHLGRLWIGTGHGLALYDRVLKRFVAIPLPISQELAKGAAPRVECLLMDRQQNLWIGTQLGLFRLPLSNRLPEPGDVRIGVEGLLVGEAQLPAPRVNVLAEDQHGSLWIGTRGGLFRLSKAHHEYQLDRFRYDESDPQSLHDDEIYALLNDSSGDLWIGAWGGHGLARLPADQMAASSPLFQRFPYPPGDDRGIGTEVVKSLLEDRQGTIWIGTQHDGARWLPAASRRGEPRFQAFRHDVLDPTSLPQAAISVIVEDRHAGVWVGSRSGGLAHHVPSTADVVFMHPPPERGSSPRENLVIGTIQTRDGTVWAATQEGLHRLREVPGKLGTFELDRFRHDPEDARSLSSSSVHCLFEDSRGRLWAGTVGGGLNEVLPGPVPRFVHYGAESGVTGRSILSLSEDSQGVIWLSSYSGIFHSVSAADGSLRFQELELPEGAELSSTAVHGVVEDPQGRYWIGTDEGVDRLDENRSRLVSLESLAGVDVSQMELRDDGWLWIATANAGLVRFHTESGEQQRWGRDHGLAEDNALGFVFDRSGKVWVAAGSRIFRIDPAGGAPITFGMQDGFVTSEYGTHSFFRGQDGEIYLGSVKGLVRFRPEKLNPSPLLSPVVLRSLELASRPVSVGADGPLSSALETAERLTLKPEDRTFTIRFAALAFHRQDLIRYAHRLRGFSDDWIEVDSDQRQATYTNLAPGTYRFEVRAKNDMGSWSAETAEVEVVVLPRWYQTLAFRLFLALVGVVLPALWIWLRFRRLHAHRRQLQDLVDRWRVERHERERLQDLSVDAYRFVEKTREPLVRIYTQAQSLSRRATGDGRTRRDLLGIVDQADQAISRLGAFLSILRGADPTLLPVDLGSVIDAVLGSFGDVAQEDVQQKVHQVWVMADEALLNQMLFHLISERVQKGVGLRFHWIPGAGTGALRIEETLREGGATEPGGKASGLAAAQALAGQQQWSIESRRDASQSLTIEIRGIKQVDREPTET